MKSLYVAKAVDVIVYRLGYTKSKYLSKNSVNFSITVRFLLARSPLNLDIGGNILSISMPVVFNTPSLNELLINVFVSSRFNLSVSIIFSRSDGSL